VDDTLSPNAGQPHPYQQTIDAVIAALGTEPECGLGDLDGFHLAADLVRLAPS
jgi:hypothetical protein